MTPSNSALTPVTVVTGFLGSGKTMLIARLLRQPGFANTADIVNAFSKVGLDRMLVERLDGNVVERRKRVTWSGNLLVGSDLDRFVLTPTGVAVQHYEHASRRYAG